MSSPSGAAWFLDNGDGSEGYSGTLHGHGLSTAPLHLIRVDLDSGAVTSAEVGRGPGGLVANPPVIDRRARHRRRLRQRQRDPPGLRHRHRRDPDPPVVPATRSTEGTWCCYPDHRRAGDRSLRRRALRRPGGRPRYRRPARNWPGPTPAARSSRCSSRRSGSDGTSTCARSRRSAGSAVRTRRDLLIRPASHRRARASANSLSSSASSALARWRTMSTTSGWVSGSHPSSSSVMESRRATVSRLDGLVTARRQDQLGSPMVHRPARSCPPPPASAPRPPVVPVRCPGRAPTSSTVAWGRSARRYRSQLARGSSSSPARPDSIS